MKKLDYDYCHAAPAVCYAETCRTVHLVCRTKLVAMALPGVTREPRFRLH